jgi:hypothetical protein
MPQDFVPIPDWFSPGVAVADLQAVPAAVLRSAGPQQNVASTGAAAA